MPEWILIFNKVLAGGTIFLHFISVYLIFSLIFKKDPIGLSALLGKYFKVVGLFTAFLATALSLFYSEVIGFPPCKLCIIQRILIYPQVLFFSLSLYIKNKILIQIPIVLSVLTFFVSTFHYLVELGIFSSSLVCGATGPSCAERYVFEFGYISIPLMAGTGIILTLLAYFANKRFSPIK